MKNALLVLLVLAFGCRQEQRKKSVFDFYPPLPDSIKTNYLAQTTSQAIFFNLPVLYNGVDSFELRITRREFFISPNLIVIKADNSGWRGFLYNSYSSPFTRNDGTQVWYTDKYNIGDSALLVKQITPICGWKKFSDSITYFKLISLPTQTMIGGFKPRKILDGEEFTIEIASAHAYHLLNYNNPDAYKEYSACKTISDFNAFLKRQLKDNYYWPGLKSISGK